MNWEARLEDARRRRAAVLAARAALEDLRTNAETRRTQTPEAPARAEPVLVLTPAMRAKRWSFPKVGEVAEGGRARIQSYSAALAERSQALRSGLMSRTSSSAAALGTATHEGTEHLKATFSSVRAEHLVFGTLGVIGAGLLGVIVTRDLPPTAKATLTVAVLDPPEVAGAAPAAWPKQVDVMALDGLGETVKLSALGIEPDAWRADPRPSASVPVVSLAALEQPDVPTALVLPANRTATGDPVDPKPAGLLAQPDYTDTRTRVRVFLTSRAERDRALAMIGSQALRLDAVGEVDYRISATHVRYYHDENREEAERLAALTGGEARDFTEAERLPEAGYIELYVSAAGLPDIAPVTAQNVPLGDMGQEIDRIVKEVLR